MDEARVFENPSKGQKRMLFGVNSLIFEIAVIPVNYPEISLTEYNKEELISALFEKVDGLSISDGISPKFVGLDYRSGGFIIACTDQATKVWINRIASTLQLGNGISLRAADSEILCRDAVVHGYFQGPMLPPEQFFRRLNIQNLELSRLLDKWTIEVADLRDNGFFIIFKMPEEHLQELSKREFNISYHLYAVKLELLAMVSKDTAKPFLVEQKSVGKVIMKQEVTEQEAVKKASVEIKQEVRERTDVREASIIEESTDSCQFDLLLWETLDKSPTNNSSSDEVDLYGDELFICDE